jgi:hypothetical protein
MKYPVKEDYLRYTCTCGETLTFCESCWDSENLLTHEMECENCVCTICQYCCVPMGCKHENCHGREHYWCKKCAKK